MAQMQMLLWHWHGDWVQRWGNVSNLHLDMPTHFSQMHASSWLVCLSVLVIASRADPGRAIEVNGPQQGNAYDCGIYVCGK